MSHDGHTIRAPAGSIEIPGDALAALVITAAELVDGARIRRPRRGLDIVVTDGKVRVELALAARYGTMLSGLGHDVQAKVAAALRDSAGLTVEAVNVSIDELDR